MRNFVVASSLMCALAVGVLVRCSAPTTCVRISDCDNGWTCDNGACVPADSIPAAPGLVTASGDASLPATNGGSTTSTGSDAGQDNADSGDSGDGGVDASADQDAGDDAGDDAGN